jgi:hypothetical protein
MSQTVLILGGGIERSSAAGANLSSVEASATERDSGDRRRSRKHRSGATGSSYFGDSDLRRSNGRSAGCRV